MKFDKLLAIQFALWSSGKAALVNEKAVQSLSQLEPSESRENIESEQSEAVEKPQSVVAEDDDIATYQHSDPYNSTLDVDMMHKANKSTPHYSEK